jgi:hypothetical protein
MVYNTFENYDLGQLRTKLLARQQYSLNHVNCRDSKLKSQSRKEGYDVTFVHNVRGIGRIQLQGYLLK